MSLSREEPIDLGRLMTAAWRLIEMLELPDEEWEETDSLALTGRVYQLKLALGDKDATPGRPG